MIISSLLEGEEMSEIKLLIRILNYSITNNHLNGLELI